MLAVFPTKYSFTFNQEHNRVQDMVEKEKRKENGKGCLISYSVKCWSVAGKVDSSKASCIPQPTHVTRCTAINYVWAAHSISMECQQERSNLGCSLVSQTGAPTQCSPNFAWVDITIRYIPVTFTMS